MSFLPSRNYRCQFVQDRNMSDQEIVNQCSNNIRRIKLGEKLGEGSFGIVYKARGLYIPELERRTGPKGAMESKKVDFAVKFIKNMSEDEMVKEINFSYYMSETGLGPKMYDAFYFFNELNNSLTQVIFMEYFDTDCDKALKNRDFKQDRKQSICAQMLELIYLQYFEAGLICIDMKPGNFVYRVADNKVKIIDFGEDFCRSNNDGKFSNDDLQLIYSVILLQIYILSYEFSGGNRRILKPFTDNRFFPNSARIQQAIAEYLNKNDLLNQVFTWYVFGWKDSVKYNQDIIRDIVNLDYKGYTDPNMSS
jgi:hypothetical protein